MRLQYFFLLLKEDAALQKKMSFFNLNNGIMVAIYISVVTLKVSIQLYKNPQKIRFCLKHFVSNYLKTSKLVMYSDHCKNQN